MNQTTSNKVKVSRQHNKKYHSRFIVPKLQGGGGHMLYDGMDTLTLLKNI
jgi:hypothetical protein